MAQDCFWRKKRPPKPAFGAKQRAQISPAFPCVYKPPNLFFLELLLVEPVLEEGEHRLLLPVDLPVVAEDDHPVRVHGLAGEELQVLELAQEAGHGSGDVLLEVGNLAGFGGKRERVVKTLDARS